MAQDVKANTGDVTINEDNSSVEKGLQYPNLDGSYNPYNSMKQGNYMRNVNSSNSAVRPNKNGSQSRKNFMQVNK